MGDLTSNPIFNDLSAPRGSADGKKMGFGACGRLIRGFQFAVSFLTGTVSLSQAPLPRR